MQKKKEAKVTIRRMTHDDIHEVLALDRIIRGLKSDVIKYEDMASANPGTPPDLSFVAEVDGTIVGFSINRSMYLMVPLTEVCIIHAILIHPDYRGRGIGKKLIQALLNHCKTEGVPQFVLSFQKVTKSCKPSSSGRVSSAAVLLILIRPLRVRVGIGGIG